MTSVLSIICAILIFSLIIVIHEWGHFFVARRCGIDVREFAIGMGPVIFKKQGKHTLFTIRLLPFGGFCAMGEDEEASADDVANFRNKPVISRMAVIVAGAVMNLILGLVLGMVILLYDGSYISNTIAAVTENTDAAGRLQIGDEILKMNGRTIFTASDIVYILRNDEDGLIDFVVERDGNKIAVDGVKFTITEGEDGSRVLNYDFKVKKKELTIGAFFPQTFRSFMYYARLVFMSFGDLIQGKYGLNDLHGPVGIVTAISQTAQATGFDVGFLFDIAMLITVNVGIFNLLPLPALDGGRFVFLLIEAIRKKPLTAETEGMVHFAGFALLMLLSLAVTFNDVRSLFTPKENTAQVRVYSIFDMERSSWK